MHGPVQTLRSLFAPAGRTGPETGFETGIVPPTVGLQEADPDCDLDYTPGTAKRMDVKTALSTSLGFGGHNACLVFRKWEEM